MLDPSTATGQWAKGACDKDWIAACSVKSIGPVPLETPFTHYTYMPTGGNITKKQVVEIAREAATIVMLLCVAFIAEKTRRGRFACFMLVFGVWDIAYYLWLWATLSWPPSLFTWDILFLIPLIWTGPVIALK